MYSIDPLYVVGCRTAEEQFPSLGPNEERVLTFDFSLSLLPGETLIAPITVTATTSAGPDLTPAAFLAGLAAFDPSLTKVCQPVALGQAGCAYQFVVSAPTSNPQKMLTRRGYLQIRG